ncbi:hypothetical protein ACFSWD_22635 [Paenibacillus xanthanilyticus]
MSRDVPASDMPLFHFHIIADPDLREHGESMARVKIAPYFAPHPMPELK